MQPATQLPIDHFLRLYFKRGEPLSPHTLQYADDKSPFFMQARTINYQRKVIPYLYALAEKYDCLLYETNIMEALLDLEDCIFSPVVYYQYILDGSSAQSLQVSQQMHKTVIALIGLVSRTTDAEFDEFRSMHPDFSLPNLAKVHTILKEYVTDIVQHILSIPTPSPEQEQQPCLS